MLTDKVRISGTRTLLLSGPTPLRPDGWTRPDPLGVG